MIAIYLISYKPLEHNNPRIGGMGLEFSHYEILCVLKTYSHVFVYAEKILVKMGVLFYIISNHHVI